MKIGIITYYNVHNHGAVLQANALRTILQKKGHQVEFLTFDRNYDYVDKESVKKYRISISSIPYYIKYVFDKGLKNFFYNIKKNELLNKYRNNKFIIGNRYNEFDGDLVIIGSDEVFSLEIGFNPFMYGHGIKCKNIISYAGCFGPTTIEDIKSKNLEDIINSGMHKLKSISVRDLNSYNVVNEISNIDSTIVCDPVILYGYKKEMDYYKPPYKKYILIYSYDKSMNDPYEIKKIREYAKKNNLKVYSVAYYHSWCDKNILVSPTQLMGVIKNSELIITDTFHGAVLSIICNTPMIVKLRTNQNKLEYLLNEYNLADRIIEDFGELNKVASEEVDFSEVNKIINKKREKSLNYLYNILEDIDVK